MKASTLKTLSLFILFMGVSLTAFANTTTQNNLPDDEQPVHISADSLDIQGQTGLSVYQGNVEIKQGSLSLKGDKITIQHPSQALKAINVVGKPANFKRFDSESQSWVNGQADNIIYNAQKKTILLIGSAKVEQPGKHLISGPELTYDILNKTLKAQSTAEEKERISVTLMPEAKQTND